jgi:transposase
MEILYTQCCGLDVHKKTVVACRITQDSSGQRHKEVRTFGTVTQELLLLSDWLREGGCTHVAMEATGVYWRPIYRVLEGEFALLVVNAQHIKAVPGRKTDVRDAEWIADLLQHGLLTGSLIPSTPQRELRDLTRYRVSLVEERSRVVNRLQKTLEDTNLKLGNVVTDILGKSGRAMLEALLSGQTDPVALADLARGRLKAKRAELEAALVGTLRPHHCFLLQEQLRHIDTLTGNIQRIEHEIDARLGAMGVTLSPPEQPLADLAPGAATVPQDDSWQHAVELLDTIPGINVAAAQAILAEIGIAMQRFPSAGHLASWAGVCPGQHESAGKRRSGKTTKGSPWLRKILVEAAQAAAHTKNTYLSARYHRIAARRGAKKAMIALAHALLVIIYHVLSRNVPYQDLGATYLDERERQSLENRLVHRLEKLGYAVSLQPVPQVA